MTYRRLRLALLLGAGALGMGLAAGPAFAAKDTLVMGMVLEPPMLDPTAGAAAAIREVVYQNIFQGLTRIDQDGAVQPDLADSWTISPDGLTYIFTLRPGVTFSDGTAFDSADVTFAWDRAMAPDSTNAQKGLFEPIAAIATPDPLSVVVTLKRPTGDFLYNMGWADAAIVAPETAADDKTNPVGTGPYRLKNWVKGDSIVLERRDDYWGPAPALRQATFKIIPDPAAATAAMLAGDVDAFANFPAPESMAQFQNDPRFKVVIGTTEGETILAENHARKPLDDVRVRRAIQMALDRQAIVDGAMFGQGTSIGSFFAPHNKAYVDLTGLYPYNPEEAKKLLEEAGYGEGLKLSLKLPPPTYARRGGEIVAAQLKAVGIDVEIVPVEWAQWLDQVFTNKDYDLTIVSHVEPNDIGNYARDDYYWNYRNEAFKALMTKLAATSDPAARTALLQDAQRMLAEDAANGFLFQLAKSGVWNAKLQGLWENAPVPANDLASVHWAD